MTRYFLISAALLLSWAGTADSFPNLLECDDPRFQVGGVIMDSSVVSSTERNLQAVDEEGNVVTTYIPGRSLFIQMEQDSNSLRWHGRVTSGSTTFTNLDTCNAVQGSIVRRIEVVTDGVTGPLDFQAGWAFGFGTVTLTPTLTVEEAPPTVSPTEFPTPFGSDPPSQVSSVPPTAIPSLTISEEPTGGSPTGIPSPTPTLEPTISSPPTMEPSLGPSKGPSWAPTWNPTLSPSIVPSNAPTEPVEFPDDLEATGLRATINELGDGITLTWQIVGEWLHFEMSVARANQYVAYAWTANDNLMNGADVVVGDEAVERRRLGNRNAGTPLINDLLNDEIIHDGGVSTLRFSRPLAATQGGQAVATGGDDNCILSYGNAFPGGGGSPHGSNRAAISINFETGDVSIEDDTDEMIIIHAVLMSLAWLLFAPLGIIIAAFKDVFCTKTEGLWLKFHMVFQVLAVACNFAGFWVIFDHVGELELDDERHHRVGFAIFLAANVQVLVGALRPHKPKPHEKPTITRFIFEIFHKSIGYGMVVFGHLNVVSGLDFPSVEDGEDYQVVPLITGCVYIAIIVCKYTYSIILKIHEARKKRSGPDSQPAYVRETATSTKY